MSQLITIPAASAGGQPGVYSQVFASAGFSVQQATGPFTLQVGNGQPQTVTVGQSIGAQIGPPLGSVQFTNATSTAIQVTLGQYGVNQVTMSQASAQTFVATTGNLYDLGTGGVGATTFNGVNSSGQHRRTIYITNTGRVSQGGATTTDVVVVSLGGNFCLLVFPGTVEPIETDANVLLAAAVANLGGLSTHLIVGVLEIFYQQSLATNQ